MDTFEARLREELLRLAEDILYTEKAHFAAAARLHHLHQLIGLIATVAAAVAACAVVAEAAVGVAVTSALIASIGSGVMTFAKPDERANEHFQAGRSLGALRVEIRQGVHLELEPAANVNVDSWTSRASQFAQRKAEIDAAAPIISERVFRRAKDKIASGSFEHGAAS